MRFAFLSLFFLAASAAADVLTLKDGRTFSGRVAEQGSKYTVVDRDRKFVIKKSEVAKYEKKRSFMDEYDDRLAKLPADDAEAIYEFGLWLAENAWPTRAGRAFEQVVDIDEDHRGARRKLGYRLYEGEWVSPDELNRKKGLVKFGGRWYTKHDRAEIEKELENNEEFRRRRARQKEVNEKVNKMVLKFKTLWKNKRDKAYADLYQYAEQLNSPELRKFADDVKAYYDYLAKVICANYRALTEVRATHTQLKKPIDTFTTTLGASIGAFAAQSPVTIQLPELKIAEVQTTVSIPAACQ